MLKNFQLNVVFLEALGLRNVLLTCIFGALGVIFLCGVIYIARRYLLQVLQNFYFTKSDVFICFRKFSIFLHIFFFITANNLWGSKYLSKRKISVFWQVLNISWLFLSFWSNTFQHSINKYVLHIFRTKLIKIDIQFLTRGLQAGTKLSQTR